MHWFESHRPIMILIQKHKIIRYYLNGKYLVIQQYKDMNLKFNRFYFKHLFKINKNPVIFDNYWNHYSNGIVNHNIVSIGLNTERM